MIELKRINDQLSENGEKQYTELIKSNEISEYVEKHPNMTESDITVYAKALEKKYTEIFEEFKDAKDTISGLTLIVDKIKYFKCKLL